MHRLVTFADSSGSETAAFAKPGSLRQVLRLLPGALCALV